MRDAVHWTEMHCREIEVARGSIDDGSLFRHSLLALYSFWLWTVQLIWRHKCSERDCPVLERYGHAVQDGGMERWLLIG